MSRNPRRRRRELLRRAQTALLVVCLLAAGALVASFWLEWRHTRLRTPGTPAELEGLPLSGEAEEPVRVEVLNGAGDPGAARRVAEWLRDSGFDVVFYGNAERFDHAATQVMARSDRAGAARTVAESLGVGDVTREPKPELYLDATVVLGDDWPRLLAVRDSIRRAEGREPRRRPF